MANHKDTGQKSQDFNPVSSSPRQKNKSKGLDDIEWIVQHREDEIHELRQAIENFSILVRAATLSPVPVNLTDFYKRFKQMKPCLHRQCNNYDVIDIAAQVYSLQRLPFEITQKESVYIQKEPKRASTVEGIKRLSCGTRRRAAYDLGKTIEFVALEGETDIFDIMTCLTMYGIEASKIRRKLASSPLREELRTLVEGDNLSLENKNQIYARLANVFGITFEKLTFADKSLNGRYFEILNNILSTDPNNLQVEFDSGFSLTDASPKAKNWNERICKKLADYSNRPIAIISSDTHSVVNCLTGFALENKSEIIERAKNHPELTELEPNNPSVVYFLLQDLCRMPENRDLLERKIQYEKGVGVKVVRDKWDTGVDVQIIDTSKILSHMDKIDPRIKREGLFDRGLVIINMDYSFGKQGTYNLSELCNSLGNRIESISIMGKAGITCGNRFDIMIPSYIIPQINGGPYEFPDPNRLCANDFDGLLTDQRVHSSGPMLTVPGTAMQNELVLYYYIHNYGILGLEMEAGPYLEAVIKAEKKGVINDNIRLNIGYWASDNPLNPGETLAESHMEKGSIPSYALNLAILNKILRNE
ncbi:Uncharacterised protein [uncultured archaeon]|nr:Uncharacterised protein [uncultured archaeon]